MGEAPLHVSHSILTQNPSSGPGITFDPPQALGSMHALRKERRIGYWSPYRGTSLMRKCTSLGPYLRPTPRVLGGFLGGGCFVMGEVALLGPSLSAADRLERPGRLFRGLGFKVCSVVGSLSLQS